MMRLAFDGEVSLRAASREDCWGGFGYAGIAVDGGGGRSTALVSLVLMS